jgi:hypothetical protein
MSEREELMKRSDFVKTAIMVTVMAVLLPVAAAYSADWQTSVNNKYLIECTVNEIKTGLWGGGAWDSFQPKYTFCDGNYWIFRCTRKPGDVFDCFLNNGSGTQACNGATYSTTNQDVSNFFTLKQPETVNPKEFVCGKIFQAMFVTVTPLR